MSRKLLTEGKRRHVMLASEAPLRKARHACVNRAVQCHTTLLPNDEYYSTLPSSPEDGSTRTRHMASAAIS